MLKNFSNKTMIFSITIFSIFSVISVPSFSNDGAKKIVTEIEQSSNNISFAKDGIISGKQQAITKTNAIFNYTDNSIYKIYSMHNYLTTIRLQEGEEILFFAGGDTERWAIEESVGGKKNQPLVFIKPNVEDDEEDLKTNIIIVTNKHTYFLDIEQSYDKYNPIVEWQYPNERKLLLELQERNTVSIGTDDITKLNYNYSWNKNLNISPIQVFDNGENTYIIMNKDVKELPAIYVKGTDGQISLVTSKINKNYIILDRTTSEIIMELGKQKLRIFNKAK